jgi:hypothetical protein
MSLAIAPARVADRVQGIDSSLNDLVLRDGRQFAVEVGAAITPTPTISRTIDGSSSVKISIHDHDLDFLDSEMLSQKLDARIDGLWFRYMGADLDGPQINITLQDREIAILSEFTDPVSAYRKDMTRAEFIVSLVRKALPHVPIFCPQLHVVQPIETERQGKKAKDDVKANRGKGIGDAKGLTVKGEKATPAQIEVGERAARTVASHKAPFRVGVATFAALIVESGLGAFSSNYMQMIGSTAAASKYSPTVIEEAVTGFLKGYINGEGGALAYFHGHPDAEPHQIAQEAQQSGAGEATQGAANYGPWTAEARAWLEAFEGGEFSAEGASRTVTEPYKFEVCTPGADGKKQDKNWWGGIKREAKAVNWRAFFVAGRFFYIDEFELFRGMVRWAIDRDTPGVQKVKGSWRANHPATDITIEAFASHWKVPPGAVTTLGGYGPFSVGFGDAPLKKGQVGISSNRKAATGEGRARYLVETIDAPLRDSDVSGLKLVTVKLRKPTAPLPEPAAKTKTLSTKSGGVGFGGGTGEMGVLEGTPEDIVNQVVDYAHQELGFPCTPSSVKAANATHGPTTSGGTSDHQGPPNVRWAADMSDNGFVHAANGTPGMTHLAAAIAQAFEIPWDGAGLVTHETGGYRMQLIYRTMEGGDHFTHVHFGCAVA